MHTGSVATPFGRRPISLAAVRRQQAAAEITAGKTADKWKIKRDASAAMALLGLQSNSLAVLDALLSFYPQNELRQDAQLVVYPSNVQLSLRAHGMAGSTLRRHLAALVDAGLIVRKDSANGKRFARKDDAGDIESAFGFDLSPLLARAEELAAMAERIVAARVALRRAKENLTICRRDVRKLISAAMEEDAGGDWQAVENVYIGLIARLPRAPTMENVSDSLQEMESLKREILNRLKMDEKAVFISTNDAQIERHIQNSNTENHSESEPLHEDEQGARLDERNRSDAEALADDQEKWMPAFRSEMRETTEAARARDPGKSGHAPKAFPLGMVLKSCPQIGDYAPGGVVSNWRDLMSAAVTVRSMLGISPSAYRDACEIMGPENAAIAVACMLERAHLINSAGGYLRDLTRRTERGEFSLGPMIMALLKANAGAVLKAG